MFKLSVSIVVPTVTQITLIITTVRTKLQTGMQMGDSSRGMHKVLI